MAGLLLLSACHSYKQLDTVDEVDLSRYQGIWYDIAHLPQKFQEGCSCVTARYQQMADYVQVVNTCMKDGEMKTIEGKAFPVEGSGNSRLEVQFFWPFKGDYFVLALDKDYRYALVGSPDRKGLWILGRQPRISAMQVKEYLNLSEDLGFDTSAMIYTDQSCYRDEEE